MAECATLFRPTVAPGRTVGRESAAHSATRAPQASLLNAQPLLVILIPVRQAPLADALLHAHAQDRARRGRARADNPGLLHLRVPRVVVAQDVLQYLPIMLPERRRRPARGQRRPAQLPRAPDDHALANPALRRKFD